jgi:predicted esterase
MLFLLLACTSPDDAPTTDDTAGEDIVDPNAYLKGSAPLATVSGGACPTIEDGGDVELVSNGKDRTVKLLLPEGGTAGKPVVFVWYPLGGTASYMINALSLREYADTVDAVVVVPSATGEVLFEWNFTSAVEANDDLVLFDDMRTCLYEQLDIDLGRVSAMGFSAGALWTSYLGVHRGDTLSTILPFSGGTDPVVAYEAPAGPFPAFLPFGGDNDLYGGGVVDFQETTTNFATDLKADGHFVVTCNHEGGHTIPPEGRDMMDAWLTAHTFGQASPFANGDLSVFPDYCSVF